MSKDKLNWGIIGAGSIARVFCNALQFSRTGRLAAIASQTPGKADLLGDLFGCATRYDSYNDLLADNEIDVVYISTIHAAHTQVVVAAAQAGKHILVEKPIGMNAEQAETMINAANKNDVFLMEAFMYRCHPQINRLIDLIASGTIGEVLMVRSAFSFNLPFDPKSWLFDKALGGGGILNVGCYPTSMTRLIAGSAAGKPFLNPIEVKASGKIGATGVDLYAVGALKFENGLVAEIVAGMGCHVPSSTVIYGSEGILSLEDPWLPSTPCRTAEIALPIETVFPPSYIFIQRPDGSRPTRIKIEADRDLFSYEADTVAKCLDARQASAMSWDDTLGNIRVLDSWLAEVGVT